MSFLKYLCLKYEIRKDERFLIKKGIEKAKNNNLELILGNEKLTLENSKGQLLPKEIIALVADDYPEVTKRYFENLERLD